MDKNVEKDYTEELSEEYNSDIEYEDSEEQMVEVTMDKVNLGALSFDDDDEEDSAPKKPIKVSNSKPSGNIEVDDSDEEGEDNIFSSSEKLRLYADKVVSCLVGRKEITKYALGKLMGITNPRLFRDENHIIFQVLYNYRDKLKRISIDEEFLQLYLYRNRNIIDKAKSYINIHAYGEIDGQEDLGYIAGVVKHFKRLSEMEDVSIEEFELAFEKYLVEFKSVEAAKVFAQGAMILKDGMPLGRKKLIGFEDSQNFVRKRMAEIEGLVNMNLGSGFVTMNEILLNEKEDNRKSQKVSDFDNLVALNKVYGGVYTGMFYQVLAPLKAGKTKFCARLCHTTAVKYGNNVTVWAHEGGKEAWTAQMRAIHFDHTYNQGVSVKDRKFGVSQDVCLKDTFPSQELRDLEMSSRLDLASNPDYGVVDYIERPFEVETFLEDIDTSVKSNNSKVVIIDYLQLIGSAKGLPERERVAEAYKALLGYCRMNNVAILTPGQYKQETINSLVNKGSDTSNAEMRTAGGASSEVLRTPDIIFAFWASTQDLLNNSMKILSMPCRFNKVFPEIQVYMDLEVCDFVSADE